VRSSEVISGSSAQVQAESIIYEKICGALLGERKITLTGPLNCGWNRSKDLKSEAKIELFGAVALMLQYFADFL
jgi:hypothetical protein